MSDRIGGIISKTPPVVSGEVTGANLYAWGSNSAGRLGLAGNGGGQASGVWTLSEVLEYRLAGQWPSLFNSTESKSSPVSIGSLTNWAQVSTTYAHIACVTTAGTLLTWGDGSFGKLGHNDTISKSSPVQVGALTNWAQASAGGQHTACVTTAGTLFTWGDGAQGQLGHNNTFNVSSPVQVGALTNWAQVSAGGGGDVCAAVKTDGTLWTWGRGDSGRLGLGNTISRSSPVQVGALTNWAQVSAPSLAHCAAVKTDGTLWTWGFNAGGGLGDSTTIFRSSPVQVGALTLWAQASAGQSHTAAVKTVGTLWTWGYGAQGRLGHNDTISTSSPVQVGALTNWEQVSAGIVHTACAKTDGTLWAWGGNSYGQLGQSNVIARSSPVQIGAETDWVQVAAGSAHTAARTAG